MGRCLFVTRRGVLEKSFLINFFGVNFKTGNETSKINLDAGLGSEQN